METLVSLECYQPVALEMMNRLDVGDAFTFSERRRLYYSNLGYWSAVLRHFAPDLVVFSTVPHEVFDYVLYVLCGLKGTKTVVFEDLSKIRPDLLLPVEKFEEIPGVIGEKYRRDLSEGGAKYLQLSPEMAVTLERLSLSYSIPMHSKHVAARIASEKASPSRISLRKLKKLVYFHNYSRYARTVWDWCSYLFQKRTWAYMKKRGHHIERSYYYGIELELIEFGKKKHMKRLLNHYNKLARDLDLEKPYVFVALHAQPERSTCPLGGPYSDQFLMIEFLSKLVPPGWNILVKEHWAQFRRLRSRPRTTAFYDELVSFPNVRLVPMSVPQFDLIDKAKAVATITGTVGWEALARGVPVLVFGEAWYRECEGSFYVPTRKSFEAAVDKLGQGYKVDPQKVRLFFHSLEQLCLRAYLEGRYEAISGIGPDESAKTIADFFVEKFGAYST